MSTQANQTVCVGKIAGVFGVQGWVKIHSYTSPQENILRYSPWLIEDAGGNRRSITITQGQTRSKGIIVQLAGITNRDQALAVVGSAIFISRDQLPQKADGEFYWSELVGLQVATREGVLLGTVDSIMETGANDVLIIKGERDRAIPFLQGRSVLKVDLDAGLITVDWDPEF